MSSSHHQVISENSSSSLTINNEQLVEGEYQSLIIDETNEEDFVTCCETVVSHDVC